MSALDGLHVQVKPAIFLKDRGVLRVCKWARRAVAQAGQIVLVAAEGLCLRLGLERAEALIDDLPDDLRAGGRVAK